MLWSPWCAWHPKVIRQEQPDRLPGWSISTSKVGDFVKIACLENNLDMLVLRHQDPEQFIPDDTIFVPNTDFQFGPPYASDHFCVISAHNLGNNVHIGRFRASYFIGWWTGMWQLWLSCRRRVSKCFSYLTLTMPYLPLSMVFLSLKHTILAKNVGIEGNPVFCRVVQCCHAIYILVWW